MADDLVSFDRVTVEYRHDGQRLTAVSELSVAIGRREFVAIIGPSGCGKTTLLKVLAGLLPVTSGTVAWSSGAPGGALPTTGVVFQSPRLLPWRRVLDNVAFGIEASGRPRREARLRGLALLERVGLRDFADTFPRELSGGMQQRVNLARALGIEPDLMLLDEPFASLDAQTRESMQAYLDQVWRQEGSTAVMVTHQVDEAVYLADRVIVLSPRPARLVLEVPVPFERPRPLRLKRTPEFRRLEDQIWDSLHEATTDLPPMLVAGRG